MSKAGEASTALQAFLRTVPNEWFTASELVEALPGYNNYAHGPMFRTLLKNLTDNGKLRRRGIGGPKAKGRGGSFEYQAAPS